MTVFEQIGRAITCGVLALCGSVRHHQSNFERWPGEDPATTRPDVVIVGESVAAGWHPAGVGVLNHARSSQTMRDVAEYIHEDALVYNPRAIVLGGGVNDFRQQVVHLDSVVQLRLYAFKEAKKKGVKVFMLNAVDFDETQPSCSVSHDADMALYNGVIAAMCAAENNPNVCELIDAAAYMGPFDQSRFSDCIHPNLAGYARFDAALAAVGGLQ